MERVIDRTAYRRSATTIKELPKENVEHIEKKVKKFLYQLLISTMIFLLLAIARIYKVEQILTWVETNINKEMDFEELYKYGQNKIVEIAQYINSIEKINIDITEEGEGVQQIQQEISAISEINDNNEMLNEQQKFEEAVEGVNQLVEDAEYIKENYKLKHAIIGTVTSIFGVRESDNKIVTPYHSGIDVAANTGTNIYASIGGEVVTAGTDNAYGKYIMIQTDDVITVYAHCSELKVKEGQKVKQGELIGKVGSTGWATGPHLHFEIRLDGRLVNPADVLDYSDMGA